MMRERALFVAVLSSVQLYELFANQCIFSTFTGVKAGRENGTESFIVDDYYNDCEYLCYKNPSKCAAANLVPDENEKFRCEFISPNSTVDKLVLEPNPKGKHISRLSDDSYLVRIDEHLSCSASTSYKTSPCEQAFDGDFLQAVFLRQDTVSSIDIWFNTIRMGQWKKMSFTFSDGSVVEKERDCVGGSPALNRFLFNRIRTTSVTWTCTELCRPRGWVLIFEMAFYELFLDNPHV